MIDGNHGRFHANYGESNLQNYMSVASTLQEDQPSVLPVNHGNAAIPDTTPSANNIYTELSVRAPTAQVEVSINVLPYTNQCHCHHISHYKKI